MGRHGDGDGDVSVRACRGADWRGLTRRPRCQCFRLAWSVGGRAQEKFHGLYTCKAFCSLCLLVYVTYGLGEGCEETGERGVWKRMPQSSSAYELHIAVIDLSFECVFIPLCVRVHDYSLSSSSPVSALLCNYVVRVLLYYGISPGIVAQYIWTIAILATLAAQRL